MACATVFAAKENSPWSFQNWLRVGYDDNVYQSANETDTMFITDVMTMKGKFHFSDRSDLMVYWQPEFRYRPDADPEMISYQDLYAQFNHAVSQRMFLTLSDRFRYQDKEAQSDLAAAPDQNYIENNLMGAMDFTFDEVSHAKVGGGYEMRRWDEEAYGKWNGGLGGGADYDQYRVNGSYIRQLRENVTQGVVGVNYTDHEYEGDRGGYASTTVYGGVDHNFAPNVVGTARLGYSFTSVENASGDDDSSSTPYAQATLAYSLSDRTRLNGSVDYSVYRADNRMYNAQDRLKLLGSVSHDFTAKFSVSSSISLTHSVYESDYAAMGVVSDADDNYMTFNVRGSFEINPKNFVDAGYTYSERWADGALSEFSRNVVDIGWRLTL